MSTTGTGHLAGYSKTLQVNSLNLTKGMCHAVGVTNRVGLILIGTSRSDDGDANGNFAEKSTLHLPSVFRLIPSKTGT